MSGRVERVRSLFIWAAAGLALLAGCSKPEGAATLPNTARLGAIQYAYQKAAQKLHRPPAKLEEIRPYLTELGNPEELLVSPRDGKPYVIVWGFDREKAYGPDNPVWVYEQDGAQGERIVLTLLGIMPMSDAEFAKQKLPKPK